MICIVVDCDKPVKYKGLCITHYNLNRKQNLPQCSVENCNNQSVSKGLCNSHYNNQRSLVMPPCIAEGCIEPSKVQDYCYKHYSRLKNTGKLTVDPPKYYHITKQGYKQLVIDGKKIFEHRFIMQEYLGRELTKDEQVHHINGNRLDNRLENLELWSRHQPAGQRIEDKIQYAIEILNLYHPGQLKDNHDNM